MDGDYPETINGVCIKVEPRSPCVGPSESMKFEDECSRQSSSPFENSVSNEYRTSHDFDRNTARPYSKSSSDFSGSGYHLVHPTDVDSIRKSSSPSFPGEFKAHMSPQDRNFNTSTPSLMTDKAAPRVQSSYHLSKNTPPSMLGDSIYSYASFNESSFSKMNMTLKTEHNGDSCYEDDSNLNLTYPGTARPIGKKAHLPKRYKCAMCAYKTRYKSDLNRHVRKHAVAGYNCDICNMPFKTVGNVEFHKRREHADSYVATKQEKKSKFNCKLCTFGTMQSSELTRHVRKHYIAKFTCTLCNRPFMSSGSLVHHKRSIHNINDGEISTNQDGDHTTKQNGETEPVVESDEENYQTVPRDNQDHTDTTQDGCKTDKQHHDMNGNIDQMTSTPAAVTTNGDAHEETSLENKLIESLEKIPNKAVLNGTLSEPREGEAMAKYKCQFCNKSFGRKLVLDYHLKNIHKMKIKEDESAFLEYDDDYDLALDMSIQEMENCEPIANTYETVLPNNTPERVDFKHMRHQCPFCAYATNYKSTYDRHVKKHDLECHICHVCRMPFITYGHMQRHIRDNHPEYNQSITNKTATGKGVTLEAEKTFNKPPLRMSFKRDFGKSAQSGLANYQAVPMNGTSDTNMSFDSISNPSKRKKTLPIQRPMEEGVTTQPPQIGRYAKLVSNFDDFASRPFACALCFFRTNNVDVLVKHTKNHLTGCNLEPVPDTARFNTAFLQQLQNKIVPKIEKSGNSMLPEPIRPIIQPNMATLRKPNNKLQDVISKLWNDPKPIKQEVEEEVGDDQDANISDSIIPTFSVHYRKDKTNLTRPYLCLLCRKRFRLLTILKQHFRQTHSESQISNKSYTCNTCGEIFNSPVLLQEHYDFQHKMQTQIEY